MLTLPPPHAVQQHPAFPSICLLVQTKITVKIKSKWYKEWKRENETDRKTRYSFSVYSVCVYGWVWGLTRERERHLNWPSGVTATRRLYSIFAFFLWPDPQAFPTELPQYIQHLLYTCVSVPVHVCLYVHDFDLSLRRCGFHRNCWETERKRRKRNIRKKRENCNQHLFLFSLNILIIFFLLLSMLQLATATWIFRAKTPQMFVVLPSHSALTKIQSWVFYVDKKSAFRSDCVWSINKH